MVVGRHQGESLPSGTRNLWDGNKMKWTDESTQTGYYIGVLATEYELLARNGQNTDRSFSKRFFIASFCFLFYRPTSQVVQLISKATTFPTQTTKLGFGLHA